MTAPTDSYSSPTGQILYGGKAAPTAGVPAWVPPSGYFADIPATNYAGDVAQSPYSFGEVGAIFNRWTGGCILRDYSVLGAWTCLGAGHSPGQPDIRINPVFDFSTLTWYGRNALTSLTGHYPDDPTQLNDKGLFVIDVAPNTMCLNPHTYLGVQEMPAAWGGGSQGSIMQFSYAGSNYISRVNIFDASRPTYGHSQLVTVQAGATPTNEIRMIQNGVNPAFYPISARDDTRQGWWFEANLTHDYTLFCDKVGNISQFPSIHGNSLYACMTHVTSKDLLVFLNGGTSTTMKVRNLATGVTNTVPLIGPTLCFNAGGNESRPEIGGFLWVEELGVIAGIDCMNLPMKFMIITPPSANADTAAWTISEVPMQHWSAGDPSGSSTIRFAQNGNFSKFQWVPALHAFVLATSHDTKPQVFKI